jgi:hypothetical protein
MDTHKLLRTLPINDPPLPLLDLASERHIAIRDRAVLYRFLLKPVTGDRWLTYFQSIESSSETRGREQFNTIDAGSALLSLVEDLLISAWGYKTPGDQTVSSLEGWKQKIPMGHRMAIGTVLTSAAPSTEDGEVVCLGGDRSVEIESLWNADDKGNMERYPRLVHKFKEPSFDHERKYRRDSGRSKVIGGSRTGKTVWMGSQPTLIKIYDELIQGVEGYCYGDDDLSAPGHIVQYMDAHHKVIATRQLFGQAEV